jgi:signal transduction histidine kinase
MPRGRWRRRSARRTVSWPLSATNCAPPLTAVVGLGQLLDEQWEELESEEGREIARDVALQGQELSHLIEDLLVSAQAEIGQITVAPREIKVSDELNAVLSSFSVQDLARVRIDIEPVAVWADPVRFRQILRNLLSNAVRYGGEHVGIGVRVAEDTPASWCGIQEPGSRKTSRGSSSSRSIEARAPGNRYQSVWD